MRESADPGALVGSVLTAAIVGWHQLGSSRTKVQLFLATDETNGFEVRTSGTGDLDLIPASTPSDLDMAESGSITFRPVDDDDPVHGLLGEPLQAIRPIRWRGVVAGLRLETAERAVVLFNDADDIFVSDGALPPDYLDAVVDG